MAITLSQSTVFSDLASAALSSHAYPSAVAAHDLLTIIVADNSSAVAMLVSTITDSQGNVWLLSTRVVTAGGNATELWYARDAVGGNCTCVITYGSTLSAAREVGMHAWAGVDTSASSVVETVTSTNLTSSIASFSAGVSVSSGSLWIETWRLNGAAVVSALPTGFSTLVPFQFGTSSRAISCYKIETAAETSSLAIQYDTSRQAVGLAVSFRAAGAAAGASLKRLWRHAMMGVQ